MTGFLVPFLTVGEVVEENMTNMAPSLVVPETVPVMDIVPSSFVSAMETVPHSLCSSLLHLPHNNGGQAKASSRHGPKPELLHDMVVTPEPPAIKTATPEPPAVKAMPEPVMAAMS
ncbi:hypothetical protein DPX16_12642 [Anabarilius grahami]|uniref:Uncharacterized protein n=1 Tax=Anabarilius grahami TaxID=495550 RepID=A0A3N0YKS0_ANAGA|nr:hypothetical protein DPX16_12642 [Anabarilius grahami]